MPKDLILEVSPHRRLYRDPNSGIAWVEDGTCGMGFSAHPNIDKTGCPKALWGAEARTVQAHGFIYHMDTVFLTDTLDCLAACYCTCRGCLDWCAEHPAAAQLILAERGRFSKAVSHHYSVTTADDSLSRAVDQLTSCFRDLRSRGTVQPLT